MLNTHLSDSAHRSHLNEGQDLTAWQSTRAGVPGEPVPDPEALEGVQAARIE
jgi:hypothetical protein